MIFLLRMDNKKTEQLIVRYKLFTDLRLSKFSVVRVSVLGYTHHAQEVLVYTKRKSQEIEYPQFIQTWDIPTIISKGIFVANMKCVVSKYLPHLFKMYWTNNND